jgi:hypothetical protein
MSVGIYCVCNSTRADVLGIAGTYDLLKEQ